MHYPIEKGLKANMNNLDRTAIQNTINKNSATSYGLTTVIGLPFSPRICDKIRAVQQELKQASIADRFTWYNEPDQFHASLVAPLRGRYADKPKLFRPVQQKDLPPDFVHKLGHFFTQIQPFPLILTGVKLTENGTLVIICNDVLSRQRLADYLDQYSECDPPKHPASTLYISIGYLNTIHPFAQGSAYEQFARSLVKAANILADLPIEERTEEIEKVWLVHYTNRTLEAQAILGKICFTLGNTPFNFRKPSPGSRNVK